jgi:hypothetical protein
LLLLIVSNSNIAGNSHDGIIGYGPVNVSNSTISGNTVGIETYTTLTVSSCTMSGNSASGIDNLGLLTLTNSTVSGTSYGSGIYNAFLGMVTLTNSTVSGNSPAGIANYGRLTLTNSTVSGNMGGIFNSATVTVSNSTISGNVGLGGISNQGGSVTISNSTISGNAANGSLTAGGIANVAFFGNDATVLLLNCTIANNTANSNDWTGSQLLNGHIGIGMSRATIQLRNTIISGDGQRPNLFADTCGTFTSQGHNLSDDNGSGFLNGPGDLTNTNPLLGPLQDNSGPTQTLALVAGSPALNAGDPAQLDVADQRGVIRAGGVNIGAYKASASAFVLTAPATATAGAPFDLTVKAVDTFGQTAVGYAGSVHFSSADGQAVLLDDCTFTSGDAGMHTFSGVTLKTAGNQAVTATDTGTGSLTGSATITVSPAAADHIVITGPDSAGAGTPFDLVVTIQDQYGNTVTGYTGTVTFATDDPAGMVPDDYAFTADDAGSHMFLGGVTLYADGSQIIVSDTAVDTLTGSVMIPLG